MFTYYMYSFGIIPLFTSRAFLPIFATILTARFGWEWEFLADYAGVQLISSLPQWMIMNNTVFFIVGIMAAIEVIGSKVPEVRHVMNNIGETKIKAIVGFFLCFFLVEGSSGELVAIAVKSQMSNTDPTAFTWGQSFAYTWSFLIGAVIWYVAKLRQIIYGFLLEMDADDNLGIQKLLSWLEDGIGFVGVIVVVIFPILALVASLSTIVLIYSIKRYLEAREEKKRTPCSSCGRMNYPVAKQCPSCNEQNKDIRQIGLLGTIKDERVTDMETHQFQMLSWKRCYVCGEWLKKKDLNQQCDACSTKPFTSVAEVDNYLNHIERRLPKTLITCFVLSLIPIIGLIPGIIYYQISLISRFKGYIPRSKIFYLRWIVGIIKLFLILLQPIPILGACTLPLMCYINYSIYRKALIGLKSAL